MKRSDVAKIARINVQIIKDGKMDSHVLKMNATVFTDNFLTKLRVRYTGRGKKTKAEKMDGVLLFGNGMMGNMLL